MRLALRLLIFALLLVTGAAVFFSLQPEPRPVPPLSERLTARARGTTEADNGFLEYLPRGYGDGARRPLLVFWPGIGENGNGRDELPLVATVGPPRLVSEGAWPDGRDWVVLSPQHHTRGCPTSSEIRNFFDFAISAYDVDPDRVYLTGLSCGAIGGWSYLFEHRDAQVAAAVLIAGSAGRAVLDAQCIDVPVWAFHGDADGSVPVEGSLQAMAALTDCPNPDQRRLTIYEGVEHDSWTQTYDGSAGHDIYAWLSQFRRTNER